MILGDHLIFHRHISGHNLFLFITDSDSCGEVEGVLRYQGDVWEAGDGCNSCRCFGATVSCTEKFCIQQTGEMFELCVCATHRTSKHKV